MYLLNGGMENIKIVSGVASSATVVQQSMGPRSLCRILGFLISPLGPSEGVWGIGFVMKGYDQS